MDKKTLEFEKELILDKIDSEENHKNMFYFPLEQISYTCFSERNGICKSLIGITN